MATLIRDREVERQLIARRRRLGQDKFDEVWNGVYVMSPLANDEHQDLSGSLYALFRESIQEAGLGIARPGVNVSDRRQEWRQNFRCPDAAVFLNGTAAINCDTHWFGGPDLAVEVVSLRDRTRKKLAFYAKVRTRELLIVDRYPWCLSLFRLADDDLDLAGETTVETGEWLASQVVPLSFRLIGGLQRPRIEVRHDDGQQNWMI